MPRPRLLTTNNQPPTPPSWRRNVIAVTGASFIGFAGFTLVMPFLPLYFRELGLTDVGEIALWSGLTLGVTPAMTAVLGPLWGRLADRFGRKLMVERSILSFVIIMAAMAYVTEPWHVFALRVVQGFFAGYGALAIAMAADSAPPEKMGAAIGVVQTAQRLGPALGPVIGGAIAQIVGLRDAFLVASAFYACGFVLVLVMYRERPRAERTRRAAAASAGMRAIVALPGMWRLLVVVFTIQFVDRSFGPILPLYLGGVVSGEENVALLSGVLFSLTACAGAAGNVTSARWLKRWSARRVIAYSCAIAAASAATFALVPPLLALALAALAFGLAIGTGITAAYTRAGTLIPPPVRASGFAVVTSASLMGVAISPMISGAIGRWSLSAVFLVDAVLLLALWCWIVRPMRDLGVPPASLARSAERDVPAVSS